MNNEPTIYKVMINNEQQYSIWPAALETPLGWNETGWSGTKQACLAYIAERWTDPKSFDLPEKTNGYKL
jgi:MbtH protein